MKMPIFYFSDTEINSRNLDKSCQGKIFVWHMSTWTIVATQQVLHLNDVVPVCSLRVENSGDNISDSSSLALLELQLRQVPIQCLCACVCVCVCVCVYVCVCLCVYVCLCFLIKIHKNCTNKNIWYCHR